MRIRRKLSTIPVLAALLCLLTASLHGEMLTKRTSQGNNLGLGIIENWAGPMYTGSSASTIQFPKGSPNLIYNDCGLFAYAVTRDRKGDGTPNDTIIPPDGDVGIVALHVSIFNYDEVMSVAASEPSLGKLGDIPYDRVWSSLDADEFAQWPTEGRWGRSAGGDPMTHGAETIFVHFGDVTTTYGYGPPAGIYSGYSFYFLDYGESNNMVYINVLMQNVSEFLKYNTVQSYKDLGNLWPDGYKFYGLMAHPYFRQVGFGGYANGNSGWAYHPAKKINGYWCKVPTISSFSPPEPPIFGTKVLRPPSYNGETMEVTNVHTDLSAEFGVTGGDGLARSNLSVGNRYKGMTGNDVGFFKGQTNPWTGRPMTFYPGLILPEDARYNQWLWGGGATASGVQACLIEHWGELHDIMPRDTISVDYVMMFTQAGVKPFIRPDYDIANLDAPVMQQLLAPLEQYGDAAQQVYEGGLVGPETPSAPPLTIVPGDRQITITWSDVNLRTPDSFYYVAQQKGWDPNGYYREYDFEGYRLYRSFVGPNDLHGELIYNCSLTSNNLSFVYVDKYDNDKPYYRMRDGMKIWYALVPYDKNYQVSTGAEFSLPDPGNSKKWNFSGGSTAPGLYQVVPRSEASNFRPSQASISFSPPEAAALTQGTQVTLTGDGSRHITEDPKYLEPVATITYTAALEEKIKNDMTVYVSCVDWGPNGYRAGRRILALTDASGNVIDNPANDLRNMFVTARGGKSNQTVLQGGLDADGTTYSIAVQVVNSRVGSHQTQIDLGGWTGARTGIATNRRNWNATSSTKQYYGTGDYVAFVRSGTFKITWKDGGGGNLTLEVLDLTRGRTIAFSPYLDGDGWGFMPPGSLPSTYETELGVTSGGNTNVETPQSQRSAKLVDKIASTNAETFRIWVDGHLICIDNSTGMVMPSVNTVFTLISAFGTWNSANNIFTQVPDPVAQGEKWKVEIKASTLKPEDADFTKIRVVPNPYIASSFLDNAADQKRVEFVNLPGQCTIRIYTLGGNLVNVLNHIGSDRTGWGNYTDWDHLTQSQPNVYKGFDNHSGTEPWNMRNRFGQTVASGLYFYHVTDSRGKTYTGRFYVIN